MRDSLDSELRHWRRAWAKSSGVCYDAVRFGSRGSIPKSRMDSHEKDRLYREGLEAFNSSRFFEAHELWEDVWREMLEPDKRFLQGLIQVAAAFHHHSRANLLGARKQLEAGLRKLDQFPDVHGGLEIERLRAAVREWVAAIASGEIPGNIVPPQIARSAGTSHLF